MVQATRQDKAHYARIGHDWKYILLLATDRELFLECHDSITGGEICHEAVAGVGYRSNALEIGWTTTRNNFAGQLADRWRDPQHVARRPTFLHVFTSNSPRIYHPNTT